MNYDYDPELPGGFQDADFEMRELTASANRAARMRKAGHCTHDWTGPVRIGEPARICHDCQEVFPSERALDLARAANMEGLI